MISKRLDIIYKLVKKNSIVADVGCDHGLLISKLALDNIIYKGYATDVNIKPLNQARKTIDKYHLHDKIKLILCNGLESIPNDTNCFIIAGMGYETCKSILENDLDKIKNANQIIVQVNRDVNKLRKWISDHNFTIINEDIVLDGHYYQAIEFNTCYHENYSEEEIEYGIYLHSDIYYKYLRDKLNKYQNIYNSIDNIEKKQLLMKHINMINAILIKEDA